MKNNLIIFERAEREGNFILETNSTVRAAASEFKVSKSTLHSDINVCLKELDLELYKLVRKVLDQNKQARAIRGGEATKQKFLLLKNNHR